jgi:transcriptional regulator with XRE-family HTH domain
MIIEGSRIRALREREMLTQQELATRLQVNRSVVCRAEKNNENMSLDRVIKYAMALGVNVSELTENPLPKRAFDEYMEYHKDLEAIQDEQDQDADIKILQCLKKLNSEGQQEAVKRVEELTEIKRYRNEY